MKPHLMIKLHKPISNQYIPYWIKFINDKSEIVQSFGNSIDSTLQKYDISYWVTKEYEPANKTNFTEHEIINGLNRIYRVILKQDFHIPEQLIQ
ncbi:MAG TPA: hypothetical protein VM888_07390, partial [Chitinophagaceae bacterium]|nr:hypothetical protein [Chitinophagaceae bacterium]